MDASSTLENSARFLIIALLAAAMLSMSASAAQPEVPEKVIERARAVFSRTLPQMDGKRLKATLVEVHYGPGGSSPPHSHPCPVIGYVLLGAYRTQVEGEPEAVYKAGDSFYEAPNGIHMLSANASTTEPATFLAYFICDRGGPLSTNFQQIPKAKRLPQ